MDVQEIFNKVINAGLYMGDTSFMCIALCIARDNRIITYQEYLDATEEITEFLGGYDTALLGYISRSLLDDNLRNLSRDFEGFREDVIGLSVYKDWTNKENTLKELRKKYLEITLDTKS